MLADLQAGVVRDLAAISNSPIAMVPKDAFAYLFGFGAAFFDERRHRPRLTAKPRPAHLVFLRDVPGPFASIPWSSDVSDLPSGESDVLVQFTGVSEVAVSRAALEVCNLIDDERLPLDVEGMFGGFKRDDGRSWIGFHDGISNLEPSQRLLAVQSKGEPEWNRGGTYLAFLRLEIDLRRWRSFTREEQESIVGRDKVTGWPLARIVEENGGPRSVPLGEGRISDEDDWATRDAFFNPPETDDPVLADSHVHRVNRNKASAGTSAAHRIFRQGYEYLEQVGAGGIRVGLNFVSFQEDLRHLQQVLGLEGWLGDTNFGGHAGLDGQASIPLATVRAGGFYAVPPHDSPLSGLSLFQQPGLYAPHGE